MYPGGKIGDAVPRVTLTALIVAGFLLPLGHPLLRPVAGDASHLLWWVHVLPVALLAFWGGRTTALVALALSLGLAAGGESLFGAGYGVAADRGATLAVAVSLTGTNVLVVASSLYARSVTDQYRALFERVRIGVIRVSPSGRVGQLNPAAALLLAPGAEGAAAAILGRPIHDLLRLPEDADVWEVASEGWTGELGLPIRSGRAIHAFVSATKDLKGGGGQILLADRSGEVLQEREYERRSRLAALGEALAGTAHEINSPLAAITAHAQLGARDMLDSREEMLESFRVIDAEALRIRDLVRELLGFSRSRPVEDLGEPLAGLVDRLIRIQRVAVGDDVHIESQIEWSGSVHGGGKVEQILLNLVSNAAHAVRSVGGGTIVFRASERGDRVQIEVVDDGPGVSPGIRDELFEPFVTTKPKGQGTGLGLAISRRLARTLGGDLTANSVDPRGASFVLSLPRDREASADRVARRFPAGVGLA